jgi:invasion protein IalB
MICLPSFRSASILAVTLMLMAEPANAQSDGQPTTLGQYGDWGAYTGTSGGRKVCFAMAQPSSSQTNPPNRPRDPIYLFISTRPAENVRNEVSIILGFAAKPGVDAAADISGTKFALQTQSDNAWLKNPTEEARMADAMRRGSELVVSAESRRGTRTTDRFSLKGLGQALDRVAQECR